MNSSLRDVLYREIDKANEQAENWKMAYQNLTAQHQNQINRLMVDLERMDHTKQIELEETVKQLEERLAEVLQLNTTYEQKYLAMRNRLNAAESYRRFKHEQVIN